MSVPAPSLLEIVNMGRDDEKKNMSLYMDLLFKGYPFNISQYDFCLHFYKDKLRLAPEMVYDLFQYWNLKPEEYMGFVELHLKDITPGWEMDIHFTTNEFDAPLITHKIVIAQNLKIRNANQKEIALGTYYVMAPMPNHGIKRR